MKQKENFIPKSKSQAKRIKIEKDAVAPEVPKDLQDQWAAVVAIATIHKLLQDGHFTWAHRNAVGVSIAFAEKLHAQALLEAGAHPQKDLIPELVAMIGKKDANGQTEKQQ